MRTLPTRKPVTALRDMAAQDIDHGQSISVTNKPKGPYPQCHAIASVGAFSSLDMECHLVHRFRAAFPATDWVDRR